MQFDRRPPTVQPQVAVVVQPFIQRKKPLQMPVGQGDIEIRREPIKPEIYFLARRLVCKDPTRHGVNADAFQQYVSGGFTRGLQPPLLALALTVIDFELIQLCAVQEV